MGCLHEDGVRSASDLYAHLKVEEVLGEEFTRGIEFLELKAIEIDRRHTQRALQLTESIRNVLLPCNLQYLRMCKALNEERLLLLYGRSDEMPFRDDLESAGIRIHAVHSVKVPRYAPCTMDQYQQWSVHWPLRYLKPGLTPLEITPSLREKMLGMITAVIKESEEHQGRGVCFITFKDRIIAKAVDEREENILSHSALLAVRKVAEMQQSSPHLMSNAKRRFTGERPAACEQGAAVSSTDLPDYLCTHCEVFMSHEPCCMCAMALLHSRVESVTFFHPNPRIGALGSVHSIHNTRQLNHHFRAFAVRQNNKC